MLERQGLHSQGELVGMAASSVLLSMARGRVTHTIGDKLPYNNLYQCVHLPFDNAALSLHVCIGWHQESQRPVTLNLSLSRLELWGLTRGGPLVWTQCCIYL